MRLAVLSHVLPPSPSGQAVVLYRILSGVDADTYYLISKESYQPSRQEPNGQFYLSARYYSLSREPQLYRPNRFGLWRLRALVNIFLSIAWRASKILRILQHDPATALIACTGDIADIPAGFLASRIARIPFYAYIFDDYVYQWIGGYRTLAKAISPFIFRKAAGMIGPNEFICEEYRQRYGKLPSLVRNPCDQDDLDKKVYPRWPAENNKIQIIYTGAVYHANSDSFQNLIQALKRLKTYNIELHIFTAQTAEELEKQGIAGEKIYVHSHIPYDEILEQQCKADILFLPLAFESPIPEVIRTSAPGKLGEYLASGRPVLAHVPRDSFVSWYFREHHCGALVDENDPGTLARTIERLVNDPSLRRYYENNARQRARLDFTPGIARARLLALFFS